MPNVFIGNLCELRNGHQVVCHAEVVGFDEDLAILAILGDAVGLSHKTQVYSMGTAQTIEVSDELLEFKKKYPHAKYEQELWIRKSDRGLDFESRCR